MKSPSALAEARSWRRAQPLLGTIVEILLDKTTDAYPTEAFKAAFAEIARVHRLMSWHAADSDVSRINRMPSGRWFRIDPCTATVLRTAAMLFECSGGLFDVTCERYLRRAGVLPAAAGNVEKRLGGMMDLVLADDDGHIRLRRPLTLNLDGIAKGYAVDRAVGVLRDCGITAGCVNAGGDLRFFGPRTGPIGLRDPHRPTRIRLLDHVRAAAMATTGGYFLERSTAARSAVMDPLSGRAVPLPGSVTVTAPLCMHADALTKVAVLRQPDDPAVEQLFQALDATAYVVPEIEEGDHV